MHLKENTMKYGRKLGLTVGTALAIGMTAPAFANDDAQYSSSTTPAASDLTLIVSGPSLVFSDVSWYTYTDGTWHQFDGTQWQNLTDASLHSTSYYLEDSVATADGMSDEYSYLGDDGIWYVWMPVSHAESSAFDVSAMSPAAYDVEFASADDTSSVYGYADGQWYVLVPMAAEEPYSHVVYLY